MTSSPTGIRLNVSNPDAQLFAIELPDSTYYKDVDNVNAWPLHVAKLIARNVSKKRHCITTLRRVEIEEPVNTDSPYDHVLHYVDGLKGMSLRDALYNHNLPYGRDAAYSKRERLIAHLLKGCDH